jgi:hypothetical protein
VSGGIYSIDEQGRLTEMREQPYISEDDLQRLLEQHPELLAEERPGAEPRRLLLLKREAGLPAEEDGAARWSVDHLFLDQDAVPTLVEVKRSSDTRIRRELLGQMLDYAANAVRYWSLDKLQSAFASTCASRERSPEETLAEFLGTDADQETFWQQAKTNLLAGRIRMIFVADQIPAELQRIVEFLNEQMTSAQMLAIEIKQYVGDHGRTLVPRLLGQTEQARQTKTGSRPSREWDETSFLQELENRCGAQDTQLARAILDWAKKSGLRITFGSGATAGSMRPTLDHNGQQYQPFRFWTSGLIEFVFGQLLRRPPYDAEQKRLAFLEHLNAIPGVMLAPEKIGRFPTIKLETLRDPAALKAFLAALDWFVAETRAS